jgi:hypothetical protein
MEPAAASAEQVAEEDPIGAPMSSTSTGKLEREAAAMANCVTIAKGSRYFDGVKCRVKRSGMLSEEGYSFILNEAVSYAAIHSSTSRAEAHMDKLDSRKGHDPDMVSFNALLEGIGRKGDLGRAERWFAKLQEPALHPELGGLAPNKCTYDVMVQTAAEAGDVRRAEKFFGATLKAYKPARATYFKLIKALVRANEIKRANHVLEALVRDGCDQCEHYAAGDVKEQRMLLKSMRQWQPGPLVDVVVLVIGRLADARNTDTAQAWLGYLQECGLSLQDRELADLKEHVREAMPKEIMPARLYSESDMIPARGEPLVLLPAPVCGEDPPQRPDLPLPPSVVSVKEDLDEQPDLAALPWTCSHGAKPGAERDPQAQMRSTWGGSSTPRSLEGRILTANRRRAQSKVAAAMVLAKPVAERPGMANRMLTLG